MGLLDRAEKLRLGTDKSSPAKERPTTANPLNPGGLLARAEALREQAGKPGSSEHKSGTMGLLARAAAMREKGGDEGGRGLESSLNQLSQGMGLMARAEAFRNQESREPYSPPPVSPESQKSLGAAVGLLARAEAMRAGSDSLAPPAASEPSVASEPYAAPEPSAAAPPVGMESPPPASPPAISDDDLFDAVKLDDSGDLPLDDDVGLADFSAGALEDFETPSEPAQPEGLMARAEEMRGEPEPADAIEPEPGGLMARAEEMRGEPEPADAIESEPGGLMARAEEMRGEPEPADAIEPEPGGLMARAEEMRGEPEPADAIEPEPGGLMARAEDMLSESEQVPDDILDAQLPDDDLFEAVEPGPLPGEEPMAFEEFPEDPLELDLSDDFLDETVPKDALEPSVPDDSENKNEKPQGLMARAEELRDDTAPATEPEPISDEELFAAVGDEPLDDMPPPSGGDDDDIAGLLEGDDFLDVETVGESERELEDLAEGLKELDEQMGAMESGLAAIEDDMEIGEVTPEDMLAKDAEDFLDLPPLDYEGPSGPEQDPALDEERLAQEKAAREEDEEGLFDEWHQEALNEAQFTLEEEAKAPETDPENPFLFESDDDFSTTPVESHIAGQKKIDNYLSLFDISKELTSINDFDELWESVLYAILGQVGAESILIFSSANRKEGGATFHPVAHSGFELPGNWLLKPGDAIYDNLAKDQELKYSQEFLESPGYGLSELERKIIEDSQATIVAPLMHMGNLYGIVFLGPQLSGDNYSIDDLEFLSLLGETAAVGVDRVLARLEFERDTEELRKQNEMHGKIFNMARNISGIKNIDELYDTLADHLRDDFQVESFSVVLLSPGRQEYRLFGGNQISPESIEKFKLGVNSELISMIANLIRVYELPDFRQNRDIASCYTNDDLAIMEHYWILPLISLNWLVGYITIHRVSGEWTENERELIISTAEMMAPVFANATILGERESLFRDPFSPLEGRLKKELEKAAEFQTTVSLVEIRVKNIKRLIQLNSPEQMAEFLANLGHTISSFLFEADFLARISQGRFAMILPGRNKSEAEVFVKKLKADFRRKRFLPGSPLDVQYVFDVITAPTDTDDPGKMLAMLD